ncbi:hypothetical protein BJX70DRAFT_357475 [Aspergillus crustosus]
MPCTDELLDPCANCAKHLDVIRWYNFIPTISLIRPAGTFPVRFWLDPHSGDGGPHFDFVNEERLRQSIFEGLAKHFWRDSQVPMSFHIKFGKVTTGLGFRPAAPIEVIVDMPVGSLIIDDDMKAFIRMQQQFDWGGWTYETRVQDDHAERLYRLQCFADWVSNMGSGCYIAKYIVTPQGFIREYLRESDEMLTTWVGARSSPDEDF